VILSAGAAALAGLLLLAAVGLGLRASHWLSLSGPWRCSRSVCLTRR
jgi:hypothetical protein